MAPKGYSGNFQKNRISQKWSYNVARPSRMLSWPFRMIVHQPIAIYIAFYIYQKKIFVRGVVRGIDFEKSLLERLSPEGGQNWHKLPSHMSYNMPKSNKNTSLAHPSGKKQRLFVNLASHLRVTLLRTPKQLKEAWLALDWPIKRQKWQKSLFSPSGTLLVTYSVI